MKMILAILALILAVPAHSQILAPILYKQTISAGSTYTDSFPYSAGDLVAVSGGNWTYPSGSSTVFSVVSSGSVKTYQSTGWMLAHWSGAGSFTPSQYSTTTLSTVGDGYLGPAVLVSGSATTGYMVECDPGTGIFIDKIVAGSKTTIATETATLPVSGGVVELEVVVTSSAALTVKYNGIVISALTYTDSSSPILTGTPGIGGYNSVSPQYISAAAGGSGSL
jgi:hypothetical protein